MNLTNANEADVREEIVAPLLAALGYKRGTSNDIARELPLTYEHEFLGRKKKTDPPLRGRADYILTVTGAGRWVLETKAAHTPIDINAIEQAISYARHPEVSASYAVILNGVRLTVHHASQKSTDTPRIDLPVSDVVELAERLRGVLSPAAIRRDCSPPVVDLGRPLAEGLRSKATIRRGDIQHENFSWSSNVQLPAQQVMHFDEMCRRLTGFRVAVTGGTVWRDEHSRIRAKLLWAMPHDDVLKFALDKRLLDVEYVALDGDISDKRESPTVFDVVGEVRVSEGEAVFDVMQWRSESAGIDVHMQYQGQATGYISDLVFRGTFHAKYMCVYPAVPSLQIRMATAGTFSVELDAQ